MTIPVFSPKLFRRWLTLHYELEAIRAIGHVDELAKPLRNGGSLIFKLESCHGGRPVRFLVARGGDVSVIMQSAKVANADGVVLFRRGGVSCK